MPPGADASAANEAAGTPGPDPGRSVLRRLRLRAARIGEHWPGRIALEIGVGFYRMQIFDRAMTVAAQTFTSIFPVLIMLAALLGQRRTVQIADFAGVPEKSLQLLNAAMSSNGVNAFGVVGSLIVLVSATSLARALVRAYAIIWKPDRLPGRLAGSWRWLLIVLLLVVFVIGTRLLGHLTDGLAYPHLSLAAATFGSDFALTIVIPWLLLNRAVSLRMLAPGAVVFALIMLAVRPAGAIYLPRALDTSERRYGPIGLAFTYLSWLYVLSFALLAAVVAGYVLATDRGVLGQWIRGDRPRKPR
jgi:membrane protein